MFRNRMLFAACLIITGCHAAHRSKPQMPATRPVAQTSPHAEAIALVAHQHADQIRKLDGDDWWTDTMERVWIVRRTGSPGIFDTTHDFYVEYNVGGLLAARWSVNTRKRSVTDELIGSGDGLDSPDSFTRDYSCERILNEALRLQELDPAARAGELLKLARAQEHFGDVFSLCRMLFEAKPGGAFRPPGLGAPVYIWRDSRETWPLEPITIFKRLPILVVHGYNISGRAEWPIDYLQYCLTECRWRTEKYAPISPADMRELMDEFIKLYPTGLTDVEWLRKQVEPTK